MFSLLAKLFGRSSATAPRPPFRPSLSALEARENPAALYPWSLGPSGSLTYSQFGPASTSTSAYTNGASTVKLGAFAPVYLGYQGNSLEMIHARQQLQLQNLKPALNPQALKQSLLAEYVRQVQSKQQALMNTRIDMWQANVGLQRAYAAVGNNLAAGGSAVANVLGGGGGYLAGGFAQGRPFYG